MDKKQITVESFVDLAYYNGLLNECKRLYEYIRDYDKEEGSIPLPDWLNKYDCNHFMRVFWSILVIEYGDYGTSPRFGWLNSEDVDLFLDEFKESLGDLE